MLSIFNIFYADIRIAICADNVLRDGIKFAVVARTEELKKFCGVPRLDSKEGKSIVKYLYEYMIDGSSLPEIPSTALYESLN